MGQRPIELFAPRVRTIKENKGALQNGAPIMLFCGAKQ